MVQYQQDDFRRIGVGAKAGSQFVRLAIIAGIVGSPLWNGCSRPKPPPVAKTATDSVEQSSTSAENIRAQMDETLPTPSVEPSEEPSEVTPVAETTQADQAGKAPSEPPPRTARVMLLARTGPLLVDLHVTRDGHSIKQAFNNSIDQILEIAGASEDEPLTWKTLLAHPRFRDGQFGNPASGNYQSQVEAIRQYDTTKNGRVDRNELIRYLTNNQTSRGLSFFTSNDRQLESREGSWIAGWLDQDSNSKLDDDELRTSAQRLLLRDIDDDGLLISGELSDTRARVAGVSPTRSARRTSFAPKTGWIFEEGEAHYPWSDIRVALENAYCAGQPVRREDLGQGARIFDDLDLDSNHSLDVIEMEMLTEIDADLKLQVDFNDGATALTLLASRFSPDQVLALIQHQPNRVTLKIDGLVLDLFGIGNRNNRIARQQAQDYLSRADEDADGQLSAREFASAGAPFLGQSFDVFDLDEDESLSAQELETVAGQSTLVSRNQVRVRADGQSDALFAVLDVNADGRLDAREIAAAPDSLLTLDHNQDGQLRASEFSDALLLGVVLGVNSTPGQNTADPSRSAPPVRRINSDSTPSWFVGMDRNGDQSISWREFLGTRDQFQQLDRDQDGFVDISEATNG